MKITNYENIIGEPMVEIENEDGSITSMTKAQFDELEAAKENGTIS